MKTNKEWELFISIFTGLALFATGMYVGIRIGVAVARNQQVTYGVMNNEE